MAPKILVVLTSHARDEESGAETGWWLSELAHPYHVLSPKAEIIIASPKGGQSHVFSASTDPARNDDAANSFFNEQKHLWENTHPLAEFAGRADEFDAIFFPGGHGPMFDLATDAASIQLIKDFYAKNKVLSAVCHGPAAFVNVVLPDGKHLLDGKEVTGLSNVEERHIGTDKLMPFLLEDRLQEVSGGKFTAAEPMGVKVSVQDGGKLITGQNPASAMAVGEAIAKALGI